jgi:hypothetical protein
MKKLFGLIFIACLSQTAIANLTFPVPVSKVYVPYGFDSNDSVEVYVTGFLPTLCYQNPNYKITKVVGQNVFIELEARVNSVSGMACPEVIVPYEMTIRLGQMRAANYRLIFNYRHPYQKVSAVGVRESGSSSVDDYLYAMVSDIKFKGGVIEVTGENPSSCFALDKVEIINNGRDTYSVLPKLKMVSSYCPRVMVPFNYRVKFNHVLNSRDTLFHIRTMNGRAHNQVLNFQ